MSGAAKKILISTSTFAEVDPLPMKRLREEGFSVTTNPYKRKLTKDADGNPIYCIGKENLFYKIAEGYLPPNKKRIRLIEEYFTKAIETAKSIGLLLSYETKPGATGDILYYFTISKDWE